MTDRPEDNLTEDVTKTMAIGGTEADLSLKYAVPELAGAQVLAQANANGSNKSRKKARILAFTMIFLWVGLPILIFLLSR